VKDFVVKDLLRLFDVLCSLGFAERDEVDDLPPYKLRYTISLENVDYIESENLEELVDLFAEAFPNSAISWDIDMDEMKLHIWIAEKSKAEAKPLGSTPGRWEP
jgi:hypothetical protein